MCGTSICCVHLTCAAGDISSGSVSANLWTQVGQDLHAKLVKDVSTLCTVCTFCVSFIQYLVESSITVHPSPITHELCPTASHLYCLPSSGLHLVLKGGQRTLILAMHATFIILTARSTGAVTAAFSKQAECVHAACWQCRVA